jgi:hypothetical protein
MANSAIRNTFTQYPNSLDNNLTWIGQALTAVAGETLSFGDFVYYSLAAGKWYKAKADTYSTARCDGIWGDTTLTDGSTGFVITEGVMRIDSWNWTDVALWLSPTTAGTATSTQPSTVGHQIQYLGQAITATTILFNPSNDIGEKY